MQYMVIFIPKESFAQNGQPADFWDRELQERAQAQVLYGQQTLRQVWALDTEHKGAVCLFEAESVDHLVEIVGTFPLVQLDYCDYQVLPLAPYPAFIKPATGPVDSTSATSELV